MRRLPYVGVYWADRQTALAAQSGNVIVTSATALLHQGQAEAIMGWDHLRIILQLHPWERVFTGEDLDAFETQCLHIRAGLEQHGLADRVLAILVDEELFSRLRRGKFDHMAEVKALGADPIARANAMKAALNRMIARVRRVFPTTLIGHVENGWYNETDKPHWYTPLPDVDFLGIDAYLAPPMTKDRFEAIVGDTYRHAAKYRKLILMVGQSFRDPDWPEMPTVAQMRWWLDLAEHIPQVAGLVWFCFEHPANYDPNNTSGGQGLTNYPDRLYATQWYARYCGLVPDGAAIGV